MIDENKARKWLEECGYFSESRGVFTVIQDYGVDSGFPMRLHEALYSVGAFFDRNKICVLVSYDAAKTIENTICVNNGVYSILDKTIIFNLK